MLRHLNRYVMDNPQRVLMVVVVVTMLLATQLPGLRFETDTEDFLPDSQVVQDNQRVQDYFGTSDKLAFIYLTPKGANDNVLNFASLRESLNLSTAIAGRFDSRGVDSMISIADLFNKALKEHLNTDLYNYSLTWDSVYNATLGASSGNISIEDVLFLFNLVLHRNWDYKEFINPLTGARKAPIAASTLIILNIDGDLSLVQRKKLTNELRDFAHTQNDDRPMLRAQVASNDLLAYDVDQNTRTTNLYIAVGMLLITILVLAWAFRSLSYVILPMATLVIALIWTFGLMAALNMSFTAIHVAVLPLIMGLGIDYTVHICRRYQEELGECKDVRTALLGSTDHVGHALMLSATTTIIAFLSNLTSGVAPVQNFGLLAALGISFVFLLTLTLHSALRYLLDTGQLPIKSLARLERTSKTKAQPLLDQTLALTCTKIEGHPWAILFIVAIISGASIFGASHVETQFNTRDFLSNDLPVMVTAQKVQHDFRGATYSQSAILIEGQVDTPEFLNNLSRVEDNMRKEDADMFVLTRLSDEPRVDSILTLAKQAFERHGTRNLETARTLTHGNLTSPLFQVTPGQTYNFIWSTDRDQEYQAEVVWYDARQGEMGREVLLAEDPQPHPAGKQERAATSPVQAIQARVIYTYHWQISLDDLDDLALDFVEYLVVFEKSSVPNLAFATSLEQAFNLNEKARPLTTTSPADVQNLYRYLRQLQLDTDFYSNTTFAVRADQLLHIDEDGRYDAAVMWVYVGQRQVGEKEEDLALTNHDLELMYDQLQEDVRGLFPGQEVSVTGGYILTITTINALNAAQISSTFLAVILAFLILAFIYRNAGLGLTAVFPLVLVTTWVLATMALTSWLNVHLSSSIPSVSLNVMTVMVTALTIGLGIDYAIHIIERYREELTHRDKTDSITETIAHTGSALVISAVTTIAGFGVLVLSPMPLVRNFGIITAATILYSLLVAVLVLPTLLLITGRLRTPLGVHRFPKFPYLSGNGKGLVAPPEGRSKEAGKGTIEKLKDQRTPSNKPKPPGPIHSQARRDKERKRIAREEAEKVAKENPQIVQHVHGDVVGSKVEIKDSVVSQTKISSHKK